MRRALLASSFLLVSASLVMACGGHADDAPDRPAPAGGAVYYDGGGGGRPSDAGGSHPGPGVPPGSEADGAAPAPNGEAGAPGGGGVLSGADDLVDVFPLPTGAIIVTSGGVRLVDAAGTTTATWTTPREITAAAFDGTRLGIADQGVLTTLDAKLAPQRAVQLTESCTAAAILPTARFVCSPANDWDHIFYIFDLDTGRLLNTSPKYTYQGTKVRPIPGTSDFVTVTYGSPAHFYLTRVNADATVDAIGESPDHGLFPVSEVYTFAGAPTTHVVTETGLLLKIYRDDVADAGSYPPPPFVRDGVLGTLGQSQRFVAMDRDEGNIAGLVVADTYDHPLCTGGCWLERVDVAARQITSTRVVTIDTQRILRFRHDPFANRAWVGTTPPGVDAWAQHPGYRLTTLSY